jgi:ribosome maturation factor RimP
MMSTIDRVRTLVAPLLEDVGVRLYDLDLNGSVLRVTVEQDHGVSLDTITLVTRLVSRALDDADVMAAAYTLEVSSPGLERTLRTPEHFRSAVGAEVAIKTAPDQPGDRRVAGRLTAADDDGIVVVDEDGCEHAIPLSAIQKARTVFSWGPAEHPKRPTRQGSRPSQKARAR